MVTSPQAPVVSQPEPENSGCLDRTSGVSQSFRYLTIEREIGTAQVQPDLNKLHLLLSAGAAVEHSSILVENCEVPKLCVHPV